MLPRLLIATVLTVLLAIAAAPAAAAAAPKLRCTGDPANVQRLELTVAGEPAWGLYALPGYQSPFAGHADEASATHIVGNAGFERLSAYFGSGETPHCREFVVDGATRTKTQVPGTGGC